MQVSATTPRSPLTWRRLLMPALCVVAVFMLAVATPAQDNDDDGVLPGKNTPHGPSGGGGGGTGLYGSADTTIDITAAMDDDVLDPKEASVELSLFNGDLQVLTESEDPAPEFAADTAGMTIEQSDGVVALQGQGMLLPHGNLSMVLRAPEDALASVLLLVIDDGTGTLDDLLDGFSEPLFVASLGSLDSFDLNDFAGVVAHHADDLAGLSVSLVYASVDSDMGQHLSGVRLSVSGGAFEVKTD